MFNRYMEFVQFHILYRSMRIILHIYYPITQPSCTYYMHASNKIEVKQNTGPASIFIAIVEFHKTWHVYFFLSYHCETM